MTPGKRGTLESGLCSILFHFLFPPKFLTDRCTCSLVLTGRALEDSCPLQSAEPVGPLPLGRCASQRQKVCSMATGHTWLAGR